MTDEFRAKLAHHLNAKDDPCQDRGVDWPCDVADALGAAGGPTNLWELILQSFRDLPTDYSREAAELPQRILDERNAYAADLAKVIAEHDKLRTEVREHRSAQVRLVEATGYDGTPAALAALRAEVGKIADLVFRAETSYWISIQAEVHQRLRALVTDQSPAARSRPDVDDRAQYWALRALVELKDGPRDADYEERKPKAWQRARDVIAATDAAYAAWRDQSPAAPNGDQS